MSLRIITREDNQLYLKRWALRPQTPKDNAWRIFLHRFFCGDGDGHHNHPWRWSFSLILRGSYVEEYFDTRDQDCTVAVREGSCSNPEHAAPIKTRTVRWFNFIPKTRYHRIVKLNGTVWTLFFCGPVLGSWGFWMPGRGHVPWKTRLRERGVDV